MGIFSRFRRNDSTENLNVFRREENPVLFDAVKETLERKFSEGYEDKKGNFHKGGVKFGDKISNEFLEQCTSLDLGNFWSTINSVEGIQHLTNLQELLYSVPRESDIPKALAQDAQVVSAEDYNKKISDIYYGKQVYDLTPLYYCKNLRHLELNNQDNITEIDLGQFPKLQYCSMQRCENLRTIVGMWNLECFDRMFVDQNTANKSSFDFSGCCSLTYVPDLISIVCKMYEYPGKVRFDEPAFCFPIEAYIRAKNDTDTQKHLEDYNRLLRSRNYKDPINWTENSDSYVKIGLNTKQAEILKIRLDAITDTVCKNGESKLQSLYNVYQWISTNVHYDYVNSYQEAELVNSAETGWRFCDSAVKFGSNTFDGIDEFHEDLSTRRLKRQLTQAEVVDELSSNVKFTRSAYVALFNKRAVCVGMSNLFNAFAVNIGMYPKFVYCYGREDDDIRQFGNYLDHQITKININIGENLEVPYYFDVTNDLGKVRMKEFGLNAEEMQKLVEFGAKNINAPNGPSIQDFVNDLGDNSWLCSVPDKEKDKIIGIYKADDKVEVNKQNDIRESQVFISKNGTLDMKQLKRTGIILNNFTSIPNVHNPQLSAQGNATDGGASQGDSSTRQNVSDSQMER